MNSDEHLQWCKDRAMKYVIAGDYQQAVTSMLSDIRKHPETENHPAAQLGVMLMMSGYLKSRKQVEDFILGFN